VHQRNSFAGYGDGHRNQPARSHNHWHLNPYVQWAHSPAM
jgi:hypothetical protein